jgi:hypothetical protein
MSTAHRDRGAIKREDGTATPFLRAQPSSLPHQPHLSPRLPFRPPPRFLSRPAAVIELAVRLPARSLPPRNGSDTLNLITQTSQNDLCATPRIPPSLTTSVTGLILSVCTPLCGQNHAWSRSNEWLRGDQCWRGPRSSAYKPPPNASKETASNGIVPDCRAVGRGSRFYRNLQQLIFVGELGGT